MLNNAKSMFASVGQEDRPGSIEIWKMPLEKVQSVAAHSKGVERMRISADNRHLFTASKDGSLMIFAISDRDPRGGGIRQEIANFSEEILTEKVEMDYYDS